MPRESFSRADLALFGALLSLAGLADATYLVWEWYASATAQVCDINNYFSCSRVRDSVWASFNGIPTAWVGFVGFLILLVLFVLVFRGRNRLGPWPVDAWLVLFASLGALTGLGLSLIEVLVIQAVCLFCAAGFGLDLGILALAVVMRRRPSAVD